MSIQIAHAGTTAAAVTATAPARNLYIDRLRSIMTALVLLHHTAITYGAPGGWFWYELHPSSSPTSLLFTLFVATNQAYFMGFFFLLAGYFTPASLERKGYGRFLGDRFLRLGLPLLAFIFILGPLTAAMAASAEGKGFWGVFPYLWNHAIIINGPLWFAQALLLFSLGYCAWRAIFGTPLTQSSRATRPIPSGAMWTLSALAVGLAAVAIRQAVPVGVNVIGLQLGFFASYIFLFVLGIAACQFDWIRQLSWANARNGIIAAIVAWPMMPLAILIAMKTTGPGKSNFSGGLSWPAVLYALWEPFVAWGLIAAWLLAARRWMNAPSALWSWLNRRAYAVYIVHPPVLVGVSLLLHPFVAPAFIKFVLTGSLTIALTWLIADPLVRMPGLRRIL